MIKIRVLNAQVPTDLKEYKLSPEISLNPECLIGRQPNSDLYLDRPEVSRMHGKIAYQEGQYYFVDLQSKLGSWFNAERVKSNEKYLLKLGDIIKIGEFILMIVDLQLETIPFTARAVSHDAVTEISFIPQPVASLTSALIEKIPTPDSPQVARPIDAYAPEAHSIFSQALQRYFPGAIALSAYMKTIYDSLANYGFDTDNTMGMTTLCRDEITEPFLAEVIRTWGESFNCSSLAGFVMMGKTALGAAMDHVPIVEGKRRFAFYAMPHIAISKDGEVGKVYRYGIQKVSHACGALEAIVKELLSGKLKLEMDMQDVEQTIVRQKILSNIHYGDKPDLIEITKLASQIISRDVDNLLSAVDPSVFNYAVLTGIQIHGPMDTTWIYPQASYVVGSDIPGGKEALTQFTNLARL